MKILSLLFTPLIVVPKIFSRYRFCHIRILIILEKRERDMFHLRAKFQNTLLQQDLAKSAVIKRCVSSTISLLQHIIGPYICNADLEQNNKPMTPTFNDYTNMVSRIQQCCLVNIKLVGGKFKPSSESHLKIRLYLQYSIIVNITLKTVYCLRNTVYYLRFQFRVSIENKYLSIG